LSEILIVCTILTIIDRITLWGIETMDSIEWLLDQRQCDDRDDSDLANPCSDE